MGVLFQITIMNKATIIFFSLALFVALSAVQAEEDTSLVGSPEVGSLRLTRDSEAKRRGSTSKKRRKKSKKRGLKKKRASKRKSTNPRKGRNSRKRFGKKK